ncbi:MAG: Hint domain-containing protein [Pseudomonadota bacterium]
MPTATELPIDSTATATEMANEIFGSGVTDISATYTGDPLSSGIYTNADIVSEGVAPSDSGVILSTGHVDDFTQSNGTLNTNTAAGTTTDTSGVDNDSDFNEIAGNNPTFDASFLEVTFTPQGDTITLDFVIASEEYPEFINSQYLDAVGLWVNGVEAQVTIGDGNANVGNINGSQTPNLYNDNTSDQFNTEMDGFTVTLTFVAPVNPGVPNTLKIGVADVFDSSYDTNLLIAGGSVQSTIVAQDDAATLVFNGSQTLDVLDNDSSTGGALTVTHINGVEMDNVTNSVTLGTGQTITLNPDGTFTIDADGDSETVYFNYTVEDTAGNSDTALVEITQVPCFTSGTGIETPKGHTLIEDLRPGDLVVTRDSGAQPVRWIGHRRVDAKGRFVPIRVQKGAFGATHDLLLSPQHRVLVAHYWSGLLFGEDEVLVKAKDLVNDSNVRPAYDLTDVTYFHVLFDKHEIINANGVACESYLPGSMTSDQFDAETHAEIIEIFPELSDSFENYGRAARMILKSFEAVALNRALCA